MSVYLGMILFSCAGGLVASVILFPVTVLFHAWIITPFRGRKVVKNNDYETVDGSLVTESLQSGKTSSGKYAAIYEYYVDGKRFRTVLTGSSYTFFGQRKTLYYKKNNPKKAVPRPEDLGRPARWINIIPYTAVVLSLIIFVCLVILWNLGKE